MLPAAMTLKVEMNEVAEMKIIIFYIKIPFFPVRNVNSS